MFCAKCGKKIDDDSAFCPYCGQKVNAPVEAESPSRGVPEKAALFGKMKNKMPLIGIVIAFVAVVAVVFGIVKVIGGSKFGRTFSEKLFAMPWEEISEMSEKEYRNIIEEEGILCEAYTSSYGDWAVMTKTTDKFMGYDCLSIHFSKDMEGDGFGAMSDFSAHITLYALAYETADDFKEGRGKLEDYLKKHSIKNSTVFTMEDGDGITTYFYPVEVSNRNMDIFQNQMDELMKVSVPETETLAREAGERFDNCSVYKFVAVRFVEKDDLQYFDWGADFPSDKSYTDYACEMLVYYTPMTEEGYISYASAFGYDAISGKEIDIDKFKESLDDAFIESEGFEEKLNGYASEMQEASEKLYFSMLYMLEKHDFDILSSSYFKSDDEKRLWYVNNFEWDINENAPIDLSEYNNSTKIYCAVECNYNSDMREYFENDLDKALYLADKNYNMETGEGFGDTDEKRLYFLQNYSYDTSAGKVIDKEIVDALIAYQKYMEENNCSQCLLIYLDDNDIPELIADSGLVCYSENTVIECETFEPLLYSYYAERTGNLKIEGGGVGGNVAYYFYHLENGKLELTGQCSLYSIYDGTSIADSTSGVIYGINDEDVSEEEFNNFEKQSTEQMGVPLIPISYNDYIYSNVLDAYDALRTIAYSMSIYGNMEFELSDGILTISSDDMCAIDIRNFGKELGTASYSFRVAENCVWDASDNDEIENSYESIKQWFDEIDREEFIREGDEGEYTHWGIALHVVTVNDIVIKVTLMCP